MGERKGHFRWVRGVTFTDRQIFVGAAMLTCQLCSWMSLSKWRFLLQGRSSAQPVRPLRAMRGHGWAGHGQEQDMRDREPEWPHQGSTGAGQWARRQWGVTQQPCSCHHEHECSASRFGAEMALIWFFARQAFDIWCFWQIYYTVFFLTKEKLRSYEPYWVLEELEKLSPASEFL